MHRKEFEETFIYSESFVNMTKGEILRLLSEDVTMMIGYDQRNPHHCYDLWEHSIKTMQGLTCDKNNQLRVAALFHDIGKESMGNQFAHPHVYNDGHPCWDNSKRERPVDFITNIIETLSLQNVTKDSVTVGLCASGIMGVH